MMDALHMEDSYGQVDDWWATFEWSSGGMVHVHIAFWIVASPRIDKVLISMEEADPNEAVTLIWDEDASVVLNDDAAARVLTKFYDRVYTEWNSFKNNTDEVPVVGFRRSMGKKTEKKDSSCRYDFHCISPCIAGNRCEQVVPSRMLVGMCSHIQRRMPGRC